jgi:hypothetical protein
MNSERTATNTKVKQRRVQKKRYVEKKKKTTSDMKEGLDKDMENHRKMNQTEILEIKTPLNQIKKYSRRPLQQTRTSGRQNLKA